MVNRRVSCDSWAVSRFVNDIRQARRRGALPERFRAADVRRACPGWADRTYAVFLPKHRRGNPAGYTEYFDRHPDGHYSLIE
jgi:hypothetical protein